MPKKTALVILSLVILGWVLWPLIAKAAAPTPQYNVVIYTPAPALQATGHEEDNSPQTIEQMVRAAFPDAPIMVHVASAESQFVPTAKNPNSSATGVFQILLSTWIDAKCTGVRTNAADNIACAQKVYSNAKNGPTHNGTTPWNSSKGNWGRFIDSSLTIVNNT